MLGFNPPFLVDNLIIANVFGPTAVASAAPFRLADGYPQGLLDPNSLSPFRVPARARSPTSGVHTSSNSISESSANLTPNLLLDHGLRRKQGHEITGASEHQRASGCRRIPMVRNRRVRGLIRVSVIFNGWRTGFLPTTIRCKSGLEKRFSSGLSALASYTWGKTLTDGADHLSTSPGGPGIDIGVFSVPQNPNNLSAERGPAEFDITHRFVVSYIYELPWGHGRRWGKSWSQAYESDARELAGVRNPCCSERIATDSDSWRDTVLNLGSDRVAARILLVIRNCRRSQRTVERWFNTDAFTTLSPAPQAFGNSGVGIMRGPGLADFDFSIAKKIDVDENRYFQFRTELFNAFNHPNFGPPDIRREATTFGRILTAGNARIIQFGLKVYF